MWLNISDSIIAVGIQITPRGISCHYRSVLWKQAEMPKSKEFLAVKPRILKIEQAKKKNLLCNLEKAKLPATIENYLKCTSPSA